VTDKNIFAAVEAEEKVSHQNTVKSGYRVKNTRESYIFEGRVIV
jgi:hypothetical protein